MHTATVTVNGEKALADNSQRDLYYTYVQPNYFRTLNIPLSLGTGFTEAHGRPDAVAILSESAAKELWPGKNPIGRELALDASKRFRTKDELAPDGSSYRVVGIARDTRAALIDGLTAELAEWIAAWEPALTKQHCAVLAALGVNGVLGARFATGLFREPSLHIPDDRYLTEWTAVLAARIETHQN